MNSLANTQFWKSLVSSKGYTYKDIPNLTGKVAIVTGANTGLGYATAVALAGNGAHVFLACRNQERAMDAIERIKKDIKSDYPEVSEEPKLEFLELDLNNLAKSRQAANNFMAKNLPLHILVCNSGIMWVPFELSADGIETQFAVNHLGHFVFTSGLLPRLKESQPSRIVVLSSMTHESTVDGGIDFDTINDSSKSDSFQRYGRSKLSNILFAKALARRLKDERVYVNVAHPGYVNTELIRYTDKTFGAIPAKLGGVAGRVFASDPKIGALTQLFLATSPKVESEDIRGQYYIPTAHEGLP
ncbi:hypothetical protein BGZ76_003317, partial [Entomortierella beljakovae]